MCPLSPSDRYQGFAEDTGEWCISTSFSGSADIGQCSKMVSWSPQFFEYTRHLWHLVRPDLDEDSDEVLHSNMSGGFLTIAFALNTCQKVSIFGFSKVNYEQ